MSCAKFQENRLKIDGEIDEKLQINEYLSAVNNPMTSKVPYYDCQYCLICFNMKDSEIRQLPIFLVDFEVIFIYLSYFEIGWLQIVLNLF